MSRRISELPDVPDLEGAEQLPIAKAGKSFKASVERLMTLIRGGTIRAPLGETLTDLPSASSRANKTIVFGKSGGVEVMTPVLPADIQAVDEKAETAQNAANTADGKAVAAQEAAQQAESKADDAQSAANAAEETASNAQAIAENAIHDTKPETQRFALPIYDKSGRVAVGILADGSFLVGAAKFETPNSDLSDMSLPIIFWVRDAKGNIVDGYDPVTGESYAIPKVFGPLSNRVTALEGVAIPSDPQAVTSVISLGARGTVTWANDLGNGFYQYKSDVGGALLPYIRKDTGTGRAHVLDTSNEVEIHISYGQSWRSNSFDGTRFFVGDTENERYLTPYKSGGAEDGPITTGAGIFIGGNITDLANISSNEPLSIGRMAVVAFLRWQDSLRRSKKPIAEFCHAYPGSTWDTGAGGGLKPGGTSWTNGLTIMSGLETQLAAYGKNPVYRSVGWTQGGDGSKDLAGNISDLLAMIAAYEALNLPGTDSQALQFYIGLTGGNNVLTEMSNGQKSQMQVCRDNANGRTWLTTPWYQWSYRQLETADPIHTDAYGTVRHGEMEGYAKFCVEELGLSWNPLWHSRTDDITIDGAVIVVPFERPSGPAFANAVMDFDTETIEEAESYGFRVYVNGSKATISDVQIIGLDKTSVQITLADAPISGDSVEVSYAGRDGVAQPAGTHSGLWGNLVMHGATSVLNPRWTLDAWACNFIETITV